MEKQDAEKIDTSNIEHKSKTWMRTTWRVIRIPVVVHHILHFCTRPCLINHVFCKLCLGILSITLHQVNSLAVCGSFFLPQPLVSCSIGLHVIQVIAWSFPLCCSLLPFINRMLQYWLVLAPLEGYASLYLPTLSPAGF